MMFLRLLVLLPLAASARKAFRNGIKVGSTAVDGPCDSKTDYGLCVAATKGLVAPDGLGEFHELLPSWNSPNLTPEQIKEKDLVGYGQKGGLHSPFLEFKTTKKQPEFRNTKKYRLELVADNRGMEEIEGFVPLCLPDGTPAGCKEGVGPDFACKSEHARVQVNDKICCGADNKCVSRKAALTGKAAYIKKVLADADLVCCEVTSISGSTNKKAESSYSKEWVTRTRCETMSSGNGYQSGHNAQHGRVGGLSKEMCVAGDSTTAADATTTAGGDETAADASTTLARSEPVPPGFTYVGPGLGKARPPPRKNRAVIKKKEE